MPAKDFLGELAWRGLLYQTTEGAEAAFAAGPVAGYAGFDPTAASLHAGSLVPIMALVHLQQTGNRPVALVGGGTGMIGDPSGKANERSLLGDEEIAANADAIRGQLERFLDFTGDRAARMVNNADWLMKLGAVELMRDVGKHFTVNYMLAKDSVKSRMETGISYTEFSYMLLQAYDFLQLNRQHGVTLQVGGSDQWGNMTAGTELIRRTSGADVHVVTLPLLTTASGAKFGKSEAGAVWLDADRTSPYQFYQFWINTDDRDAASYLRTLTLLTREEIETLDRDSVEHPEQRLSQSALASDITARVHGAEAARAAAEVSSVLFAKGDVTKLTRPALAALAREVPSVMIPREELGTVVDLFTRAGLVKSRGEARRLADGGGTYVNGERAGATQNATELGVLHDSYVLLRKGARDYAVVTLG